MLARATIPRRWWLQPWLALAAIVAGLVVGLPVARAQVDLATYTVSGIRANAQASDSVQAQLLAIERGQRAGLEQLLQELTLGSGQAAPSVSGVDLGRMVTSFEILDETVAPGSYAATLAVSYDRSAVDGLLQRSGTGYVREVAPPALVVPLWETGSGLLLWERENVWKQAVDRGLRDDGVARFVVPLGDLQDLALLDADDAVRGNAQALGRLGARYGTESVVLARLVGSGAPGTPLEIEARRVGGPPEPPYRAVVRRADGEPLEASLARAVREMQVAFDQRVRERSMVPGGPRQQVVLAAPVQDPLSWGQLLAQLEALPEVANLGVRNLSRRQATLELEVAGGIDRLQQSLGPWGWNVIEDGANRWRLQRGAPASAAPSPR